VLMYEITLLWVLLGIVSYWFWEGCYYKCTIFDSYILDLGLVSMLGPLTWIMGYVGWRRNLYHRRDRCG